MNSGALLQTLYGNTGEIFGVAFSPDGSKIATAEGNYGEDLDVQYKCKYSDVYRTLQTG